MRRLSIGTLLAGAMLVGAACVSDPTSDLRGGPSELSVDPAVAFVKVGKAVRITATVLDDQLNLLPATFQATSNNAGIATVAVDTTAPNPAGLYGYFNVTGVAVGVTYVKIAGGALTDSTRVEVTPP